MKGRYTTQFIIWDGPITKYSVIHIRSTTPLIKIKQTRQRLRSEAVFRKEIQVTLRTCLHVNISANFRKDYHTCCKNKLLKPASDGSSGLSAARLRCLRKCPCFHATRSPRHHDCISGAIFVQKQV